MANDQSLFTDADVISTYSDGQACEDGELVAINPKDRVTRAVWEFLKEKAPKGPKPPDHWPVNLMGWFSATSIPKVEALTMIAEHGAEQGQTELEELVASRKAVAMSLGLIGTHRDQAKRTYDENLGGGIFKLYAASAEGEIAALLDVKGNTAPEQYQGATLWLLPNENGGITLMFPEDN